MKQFMIIINGPAGAGKSTISKKIWKKLSRTALINLDEVKWIVSDYKSDSFDLGLANKIGQNIAKMYISHKLNVIIDKAFCEHKYIEPFIKIAKKNKLRLFVYNVEAPLSIIIRRIKKRSKKMSLAKAKRLYKSYFSSKFSVDDTFDTSLQTIDNITKNILNDLKTK